MTRAARSSVLALAFIITAGCAPSTPRVTSSAPPGGGAPLAEPVEVSLVEWSIEAPETIAAGTVTFRVRNGGRVPHDLIVVRSNAAPRSLPTVSGKLDEASLDIVARTAEITPGSGEELRLTLAPGRYVLACNVIGHYNSGQAAGVTVR